MRAWVVTGNGEPEDVLELRELEGPTAANGQVLVDVEAVGLNFMDASICRGSYRVQQDHPFISGVELVGRVVSTPESSGLERGRRVVAVQSGASTGALADRVAVPAESVYPIPEDVPAAVAASLLVTYQTAHFALRRCQVEAGDTLLVTAGAGGVGTAAIQLGVARGARVLATARGPEKAAVCLAQGAELAFDSQQADLVEAVLAATGGKGADVIFDQVGGELFARLLDCLAVEGRIAPLGSASGPVPPVPLSSYVLKNITLVGLAWGYHYPQNGRAAVTAALEDILALHRSGAVRPVTTTMDFDQVPQALQSLGDGTTVGKLVIPVE